MTSPERDVLTIFRGGETVYDKEGIYDIWIFPKDDGAEVTIRDAVTEEILYEDLTIECMMVKAPFIQIQAKRD